MRRPSLLAAGLCAMLLALFALTAGQAVPAAAADQQVSAVAARLGGNETRTRFVTDFSQSVEYTVKVLSNPFRVIVDLPEVDFNFPPGLGRKGQGLVKAYRYGQFGEGKSRIVLDVSAPVLVSKSFVIEARNDQPARLVIDLTRTDMATFAQNRQKEVKKQKPTTSRTEEITALLQRMVNAPAEPIR
ncbi:MAG: AMIN domain-containing protein, partial [Rhizobiales bacterium]|nr:AMIN domain-containing protein [Hyphomicrobiales bacterium]